MMFGTRSLSVFLLGVCLLLSNTAGAEDKEPPILKHESIGEAPLYEPILFDVRIQDISGVFAPSVYYRYAGQADYRVIELTRKGADFTAQISGSEVTGDIEYFIEAFDEQGNGPSRLGSPNQPFRIAVGKMTPAIPLPHREKKKALVTQDPLVPKVVIDAQKSEALYEKWWFWVTMTVALAAGGTAAAWALQPAQAEQVSVRVIGPDPYGGLP